MNDANGNEVRVGQSVKVLTDDGYTGIGGKVGTVRSIGAARLRVADGPDDDWVWSAWCRPEEVAVQDAATTMTTRTTASDEAVAAARELELVMLNHPNMSIMDMAAIIDRHMQPQRAVVADLVAALTLTLKGLEWHYEPGRSRPDDSSRRIVAAARAALAKAAPDPERGA